MGIHISGCEASWNAVILNTEKKEKQTVVQRKGWKIRKQTRECINYTWIDNKEMNEMKEELKYNEVSSA